MTHRSQCHFTLMPIKTQKLCARPSKRNWSNKLKRLYIDILEGFSPLPGATVGERTHSHGRESMWRKKSNPIKQKINKSPVCIPFPILDEKQSRMLIIGWGRAGQDPAVFVLGLRVPLPNCQPSEGLHGGPQGANNGLFSNRDSFKMRASRNTH